MTGYQKTICLVDAGIAFNSPYPVLLRPERKVEIILSFDFSQRDGGDKEKPFSVSCKFNELSTVTNPTYIALSRLHKSSVSIYAERITS